MLTYIIIAIVMAVCGVFVGTLAPLLWQLPIFIGVIAFLYSDTLNSMDLFGLVVAVICIAFLAGIVLGDISFLIQNHLTSN